MAPRLKKTDISRKLAVEVTWVHLARYKYHPREMGGLMKYVKYLILFGALTKINPVSFIYSGASLIRNFGLSKQDVKK
jgi:hypothetical protein